MLSRADLYTKINDLPTLAEEITEKPKHKQQRLQAADESKKRKRGRPAKSLADPEVCIRHSA